MELKKYFQAVLLIIALHEASPESPQEWTDLANAELQRALKTERIVRRPKNVVFFLGDGMGMATLTAARIYKGQLNGKSGEEGSLSFENFPHVGLCKTYNDNAQVPDSAGCATAFFSGQKGAEGVIGLNSHARLGNCSSAQGNSITSILEWAQNAGKATGVVTTTRISHATPAGTYAHTPHRDWESNVVGSEVDKAMCKDIVRQLVEDAPGNKIRVLLGGGLSYFLPNETTDSCTGVKGNRGDHRNMVEKWIAQRAAYGQSDRSKYVTDADGLKGLDVAKTDFVLGLFASSHLEYDLQRNRSRTASKQPTLTEMTKRAIDILQKHENGFFLMVEGGRIDHAHHEGKARLALHDTVAFDAAIAAAVAMLPAEDTLFVVTADHSHTLSMGGYPKRGVNILKGDDTPPAQDKLSYLTLSYANGPGALNNTIPRRNLTGVHTDTDDFMQDAMVPLLSETHGGEDVAIYAKGPFAHLFHSLHEQNYIPVAIDYAACYRSATADHCRMPPSNAAAMWCPRMSSLLVISSLTSFWLMMNIA